MIDYSYWEQALAGKNPEVHADIPCPGYYRYRKGKGITEIPCAIYANRGTGELQCMLGYREFNRIADPDELPDIWLRVCDKPISYEVYQTWAQTHVFPGIESDEYRRLLAVLNTLLGVPGDIDGGELESLSVRFEAARKRENQRHLQAKYEIDRRYHEVLDRIRITLDDLKKEDCPWPTIMQEGET